jgi:phenylalanyl-tRNA synthetase beta subunit
MPIIHVREATMTINGEVFAALPTRVDDTARILRRLSRAVHAFNRRMNPWQRKRACSRYIRKGGVRK